MRRICAMCLLLGLTGAASGQVYKWIDGQGRVHYGDTPPAAATADQTGIESCATPRCRAAQQRDARQQDLQGLRWLKERDALERRREREATRDLRRYEAQLRAQQNEEERQQRQQEEAEVLRRKQRIRKLK